MALTAIQLVTEFCDKTGLPTPSGLVGAGDKSSKQYLAILKGLVRDLAQWHWPEQQITVVFNATASYELPDDFLHFVPNTFWCVTKQVPVVGPLTEPAYLALITLGTSGPEYQFFVNGRNLVLVPTPPIPTPPDDGEEFRFRYVTKLGVRRSNGAYSDTVTSDEDTFLFPDTVMLLGFEYHWLRAKGETFSDAYVDYMNAVSINRNAGLGPTFTLEATRQAPRPGVYIPPGNWSV